MGEVEAIPGGAHHVDDVGVHHSEIVPMSRSGLKSRAEKGRAVPVPVPPPPLPPAQNVESVDIVPGRLSKSDWLDMVAQEEGEEVVAEILDELMYCVMEKCYSVYLQKQLVPFTMTWARDALVQTLEWQFLVRDEGEGQDSSPFWEQDSEPQPCGFDSWAQGCVPVVHSRPTPNSTLLQRSAELPVAEVADPVSPQAKDESQSGRKDDLSDMEPCKENESQNGRQGYARFKVAMLTPFPPCKREDRRKQPLPHRAALLTPQVGNSPRIPRRSLRCPVRKKEECPTPKDQTTPASKSECAQKNLDLSAVKRLDPARLPRHHVWPGFEILESNISQQPSGKSGGPRAPRPKQDKRYAMQTAALKPLTTDGPHNARRMSAMDEAIWLSSRSGNIQDTGQSKGPIPLSASLLLDTMVLSPGVTLKDPIGAHTSSYRRCPSQTSYRADLKPIRSSLPTPFFSLDQMMSG
ncbi:hypothetical protein AAFF_G00337710 [Aldrovandia affinis]|uniref:Uncharacterized protein n=1 Tax=Aldrovandia affinis TaxID=143900 RepID=A0AAD7WQD0_9TELE|nr:hypothetical protein AAFF_G00337710 [Aldrovandia affinis]